MFRSSRMLILVGVASAAALLADFGAVAAPAAHASPHVQRLEAAKAITFNHDALLDATGNPVMIAPARYESERRLDHGKRIKIAARNDGAKIKSYQRMTAGSIPLPPRRPPSGSS